MSDEKYIGLDVHQATISVAVTDSQGKVVMESILETKASTLLEFFAGLRGSLFVTFEEGTWAAWLYDLLKATAARPDASPHAPGLEGKDAFSPSGRGRKMSLTSPLIDQAFTPACAVCSPGTGSRTNSVPARRHPPICRTMLVTD